MKLDEMIILIGLTLIGYAIYWFFKGIYLLFTYKERKLRREYEEMRFLKTNIYALNDREFEVFCAEVFARHGFKVELTKATGDYGRDIIINNNIYVECKRFDTNGSVGRPILQKLLGSMDMFNVEKGIVITTGRYTQTARETAKISGKLALWNGYDLYKFLRADTEQAQKMVL